MVVVDREVVWGWYWLLERVQLVREEVGLLLLLAVEQAVEGYLIAVE